MQINAMDRNRFALWAGDFFNNNSIEKITSITPEYNDMPVINILLRP